MTQIMTAVVLRQNEEEQWQKQLSALQMFIQTEDLFAGT